MFLNSLLFLLNSSEIADLIISIILAFAIAGGIFIYSKKISALIAVIISLGTCILFFSFGLSVCGYIMMSLFIIASLVLIFSNSSDFKHFFVKQHQRNKKANQNYDKEELYKIIDNTVHSLSRSKTGALMTFERSTNLDDVMKSGTIIDAPVSQELLETIFYVGTRLHDGAVVIRGNIIVAASVYYTPTTRALTGKFGSRHRAAFGISEISDSVTVVVSEETGRVSIAYNGNLETVPLDSFLREFSDLMNMDK